MRLNIKDYKIGKTKKYFKTNNLFFFVNGINQNALDWLLTEQGLKTTGFTYYKLLNKTTVKTLSNSIYTAVSPVIKGSTFIIKSHFKKPFLKRTIQNAFNSLFFELLILKFNNKMYSADALKNTYSLNYKETKLLLYQFNLICIKSCYKLSK